MKLIVITHTGEQVEARCDRCRHWEAIPRRIGVGACRKITTGSHGGAAWIVDSGFEGDPEINTESYHGCALFASKEQS